MALDLSNAQNALKVRYLPPMRKQLNNSTVLLSRIEREDDLMVSGKSFTMPLQTGRNQAAGVGRADGGTLPTAGQQAYDVAVIPNIYTYSRIKVTGPTVRAARDSAGAFITAVESEIQGAMRDTRKSFNLQLHSKGIHALGYWTGADDTSGTNIDDNLGHGFVGLESGATTCDLLDASASYAVIGDNIVVTKGAVSATVVAVTWTGTVSGSADGDVLVPYDTKDASLMGISGIIDDADPPLLSGGLQALPVATKTFWVAQVVTGDTAGTPQALTLDRMQIPLDLISQNSDYDDRDVKFLLSNYAVRRKHIALLIADKRFVNTLELDGGWKGVDFNGIPHIVDHQCERNALYYITPEVLKIVRTSDFDWADRDGAVLCRVANEDAYDAFLFHYGNLATSARNALGKLEDILDT